MEDGYVSLSGHLEVIVNSSRKVKLAEEKEKGHSVISLSGRRWGNYRSRWGWLVESPGNWQWKWCWSCCRECCQRSSSFTSASASPHCAKLKNDVLEAHLTLVLLDGNWYDRRKGFKQLRIRWFCKRSLNLSNSSGGIFGCIRWQLTRHQWRHFVPSDGILWRHGSWKSSEGMSSP